MDTDTIECVSHTVRDAAAQAGYELTEVVIFGSRVRDDYREWSDVDVLIVSPDFEEVPSYKRSKRSFATGNTTNCPTRSSSV